MKIQNLLLLLFTYISITNCQSIIDKLSQDERFSTLLSHLESTGLKPLVNNLTSATLFAPDNDAFTKFEGEVNKHVLMYHFVKKGMTMDMFHHGQLKESLLVLPGYLGPDHEAQRFKLSKNDKVWSVNQAKVIDENIKVDNYTYIQAIDRVMTLPSLLGDSTKTNNQIVYDLMSTTEIVHLLQQKKPFTLFLTSSKTPLEKYNAIESTYLKSEYGKQDLFTFFKYSIIDKVIYMDEFTSGKTTFKSLSGDSLVIASTKKSMTVNDIPIVQSDILAANGIIHLIDDTFHPNSIEFNTRKYMHGANSTYMVEYMDQYHLDQYLDQTENNYTFLVPPNDAINKTLLSKAWLSYHIIKDAWSQQNLNNNMLLDSQYQSYALDQHYQKIPVSVEQEISVYTSHSVQFAHARVIGDEVSVGNDIIYQISEPLSLPGDILEKLVLDLDFSTFIATLYVSQVVQEIKATQGLTLFVPTNDAFQKLGLVAKYLVHPTAKAQLQTVLRYHATANNLLYYTDLNNISIETLANETLLITQNESGTVTVGDSATVTASDLLVYNGVVHKLSQVLIPSQLVITNQNLLVGIESNTMLHILERIGLLDLINQENIVVLAPSDKAFSRIDLDELFLDPVQMERIAKLHIIPREWQERWIAQNPSHDKSEYPTLLSDDDKVTIRENEKGELWIGVKNGGEDDRAHVTGLGRGSAGGGVLAIDTVLLPIRRGLFGLPWVWSLVVILTLVIITGGTLSIVGFFVYKIYNRRRLGYRPIF
ncbi:FAS1 domain-containing protein [Helicostylum pulchrum]|nr:FAS1 domain-containing protein [Helicostylum pulchrum]